MNLRGDFLVIGSGIAGLRAAITLADAGDVIILTKADPRESNTGYAQGGIAAALGPDDSPDLHASDTIAAGDGLCVPEAVDVLVTAGPRYVQELIDWGAAFDRDANGRPALGREGAHSVRRVLHARDATGREIARLLWSRVSGDRRITVCDDATATSLVMREGECTGAEFVTAKGTAGIVNAPRTLLATGGAGQAYRETTNPAIATGDGIAIAAVAGARVADLEFVQFHPTVLSVEGAPRFLLSEAMRGEGARLVNEAGEAFVQRYEPAGDLASRDLVSRAIVREIERTGAPVYLTMAHLEPGFVARRFPMIRQACAEAGLDLTRDRIPISPAAHYVMGGVETDLDGRTSVPGLFAAGEVACTGVHGANRLASNSLLEGLVFGARAAEAMAEERRRPVKGRPTAARWTADLSSLDSSRVGAAVPSSPVGSAVPSSSVGSVKPSSSVGSVKPSSSVGLAVPSSSVGRPFTGRHMGASSSIPSEHEVRDLMWRQAGLVRDRAGLEEAVSRLESWAAAVAAARRAHLHDPAFRRVHSIVIVGLLIARAALRREESRGGHFRTDFPTHDDLHWKIHVADQLNGQRD